MRKRKFFEKIIPHRHQKRDRQEKDEKEYKPTRQDATNFFRHAGGDKVKARPTKRRHGTKKVENRARNKRAKAARKVNR